MRHFFRAAVIVWFVTSLTQQAFAGQHVNLKDAAEVECNVPNFTDSRPSDDLYQTYVRVVETEGNLFSGSGRGMVYISQTSGMHLNNESFEVVSASPWGMPLIWALQADPTSRPEPFRLTQDFSTSKITVQYDGFIKIRNTNADCTVVRFREQANN